MDDQTERGHSAFAFEPVRSVARVLPWSEDVGVL